MRSLSRCSLALCVIVTCSLLAVSVRGDYIAAVSQHAGPTVAGDPLATKLAALASYDAAAGVARAAGAQVIVFAEFGLNGPEDLGKRDTVVAYAEPLPNWTNTTTGPAINPCDEQEAWKNSPALTHGSCMARNHSIVLLINVFESVPCAGSAGCPLDGEWVFCTDILFDEGGNLVAKYRKSHPAFIFSVDKPPTAEMVTYVSSFGVKFGLFICFDIAFSDPAVELANSGVHDFMYAAAIGAIGRATVAKAWSWLHNANVLLANDGAGVSDIILYGTPAVSSTFAVPNTQQDSVVVAKVVTRA